MARTPSAQGPDGRLYYNNGNHAHLKPPIDPGSPVNVAYEGELLPHYNDSRGHAAGIMAPGGEILRSDDDGKTWKRVVAGFRNEYDFAFNADGELFTFDSDMEWDVGLPWYRPVRVNHCPIGAEFGWRNGIGQVAGLLLRQPAGRPRRRPGQSDRSHVLPGTPVPGEVSRQLSDLRLVARPDSCRPAQTRGCFLCGHGHGVGQRPAAQLHRHRSRPRRGSLFHDRRTRYPGRSVSRELERGQATPKADRSAQRSAGDRFATLELRSKTDQQDPRSSSARPGDRTWSKLARVGGRPSIRIRGIDLLAQFGPPPSDELLLTLATDPGCGGPRPGGRRCSANGSSAPIRACTRKGIGRHDAFVRRHACEGLMQQPRETIPIRRLMPLLADPDRWIRFAARVAIEHGDIEKERAWIMDSSEPRPLIEGMLALRPCVPAR